MECPNCHENQIREATLAERDMMLPLLSKWMITHEYRPHDMLVICSECGWFELLLAPKGYYDWYKTVKQLLDLVAEAG